MIRFNTAPLLNVKITHRRPTDAEIYDGPDDTEEWLQQMAARQVVTVTPQEQLDARIAALELPEVQS